ncbi:MAG: response regulator [Deltaproteobacteria bacterium]|nr:response regulator [Deltaproteobacteria bacterium]
MGKRVLVVDDSSMMRKMITKTLTDGGHSVVGDAKNGLEAVALYKSLKPDVVTMDITMREMDGFAAAREILAHDANARIIFLSNLEEDKYRQEVEKIGARAFVSKHAAEKILTVIETL